MGRFTESANGERLTEEEIRMLTWILSRFGIMGLAGFVLLAVSLTVGFLSFLLLGTQERKLTREIKETYF